MDMSKSQLEVIFKQIRDYLPDDEEVEAVSVARNHSNTLYVKPAFLATDWRVILVEPKNWGLKSKARHFAYEDIADIYLEAGWFTSKISITPYPGMGAAMVMDGMEKRRSEEFVEYVRDRIANNASDGPRKPPPSKPVDPLVEKLEQLKQIYDEGLITSEEYENKKRNILEGL
mgnify:CR=1 FL=1